MTVINNNYNFKNCDFCTLDALTPEIEDHLQELEVDLNNIKNSVDEIFIEFKDYQLESISKRYNLQINNIKQINVHKKKVLSEIFYLDSEFVKLIEEIKKISLLYIRYWIGMRKKQDENPSFSFVFEKINKDKINDCTNNLSIHGIAFLFRNFSKDNFTILCNKLKIKDFEHYYNDLQSIPNEDERRHIINIMMSIRALNLKPQLREIDKRIEELKEIITSKKLYNFFNTPQCIQSSCLFFKKFSEVINVTSLEFNSDFNPENHFRIFFMCNKFISSINQFCPSNNINYQEHQLNRSYEIFHSLENFHRKNLMVPDSFYHREKLENQKFTINNIDDLSKEIEGVTLKKHRKNKNKTKKNNTHNSHLLKENSDEHVVSTPIPKEDPAPNISLTQKKLLELIRKPPYYPLTYRVKRWMFKRIVPSTYEQVRTFEHGGKRIHENETLDQIHLSIVSHCFPRIENILYDSKLKSKFSRIHEDGFTMMGSLHFSPPVDQQNTNPQQRPLITLDGIYQFGHAECKEGQNRLVHRFFQPFQSKMTTHLIQASQFTTIKDNLDDDFYKELQENEIYYKDISLRHDENSNTISMEDKKLGIKSVIFPYNA